MSKIREFVRTGINPDGKVAMNCVAVKIRPQEKLDTFATDERVYSFFGNDWCDGYGSDGEDEYDYRLDTGLVFESEEAMKAEETLVSKELAEYFGEGFDVEVFMYNDSTL